MTRILILSFLCLAGALHADDTPLPLPSGQDVTLLEIRQDADANALRLRYVAPALASPLTRPSFETLSEDLAHLCTQEGLPAHAEWGQDDAAIIVSLSAEPIEFGVMNTDNPQVFEAFTVFEGTCMLEMF